MVGCRKWEGGRKDSASQKLRVKSADFGNLTQFQRPLSYNLCGLTNLICAKILSVQTSEQIPSPKPTLRKNSSTFTLSNTKAIECKRVSLYKLSMYIILHLVLLSKITSFGSHTLLIVIVYIHCISHSSSLQRNPISSHPVVNQKGQTTLSAVA